MNSGTEAPHYPFYPLIYIAKLNGEISVSKLKLKGSRVIKKFHVDTPKKCREVIANPGKLLPHRVVALAESALNHLPQKDTLWNRIRKTIGF